MPTPIRFVEKPALYPDGHYAGQVDFAHMAVGDMCFYHYNGVPCVKHERLSKMNLTAHYFAHNAERAPLILALPDAAAQNGKLYFLVDGQCYSSTCPKCGKASYKNKCAPADCTPRGHYDGWTVSGTPPLITVSPSVDYDNHEDNVKHYHGFIQNGIIGDG